MWQLHRHLHERVERRPHRIDYAGAATLSIGCSLLILALLEGGVSWAWSSPVSIGLFVLAAALGVAFVLIERRVAEPILPLWIFRHRVLVAANLAGLAIGAILLGQSSYVPTYAQRVLGVGAVVSGLAMAAMTVGWPLASMVAPRVYLKLGFKVTAIIGGVVALAGCLLLALFVGEDSGVWRVAVASFVIGAGMGFASLATLVSVQSVVDWSRRGVVTGSNMFIRTLGSAVGIAVFGSIANSHLAHARHTPAAIFDAVHAVFWALAATAALGLVALFFMPRRIEPIEFEAPEFEAPQSDASAAAVEPARRRRSWPRQSQRA
jgi:Na+/melibiose symporter-like transporter